MMEANDNQYVWCEKYRPNKIVDTILPKSIHDSAMGYIESGRIQNLIFVGGAGIGKTTLAKAMCREVGADHILINASNETGIDTFRTKILNFATSVSFSDSKKVVILDECLFEDEDIIVGTLSSHTRVKLKDLEFGVMYPTVSYNMDTGKLEDDFFELISEKEDEIYEVTFEDGRTIRCNSKHPFIVANSSGGVMEKTILDGLVGEKGTIIE